MASTLNPLLATVSGPVVQIGRPLGLTYPTGATVTFSDEVPAGDLSTVVFVAELCLPHWTPSALAALAERLRPEGRLLFVEPVCGTGFAYALQRMFNPAAQARWGYGFSRDIPAELRQTGLTVTSVDRFFVDPVPTVFTFAAGDARFY